MPDEVSFVTSRITKISKLSSYNVLRGRQEILTFKFFDVGYTLISMSSDLLKPQL